MSANEMLKARDADIIRLFDRIPDGTQWRRRWPEAVGGSIEASRQFAEFAKSAPDRALRVIDSFEPGKTERPAGAALAALGESDVAAHTLIESIRQLDGRGFASKSFRIDAARCLREVARRNQGLDNAACRLLEGWITDRSSTPHNDAAGLEDAVPATGDSILWGHHGLVALPQSNYPILDALMLGHLLRDRPDLSGWLAVLERHLQRDEDPRVWSALARDMPHLVDEARGIKFLGALFARYPTILNTAMGVQLIGQIVHRLPDRMVSKVIDGWVLGDWVHGPQAAGEIAALKLCRSPDSAVARECVDRFLCGDDLDPGIVEHLRGGLAYTLAEAWHQPALRSLSTPLLIRIIHTAGSSVAGAVHNVFRKRSPLPVDGHTRTILETILKRPAMLVEPDVFFLVESLKGLLYTDGYPVLVYDVARKLIEQAAQNSSESDAVQNLSELADISLTLHRISETREHGLDLFERLLKYDAPGLSESLRLIDRPAFR